MSQKYNELNQQYLELGKQISSLEKKRFAVVREMRVHCPHNDLSRVESYPFHDIELDDEIKYKCSTCFQYFTENELKELNKN